MSLATGIKRKLLVHIGSCCCFMKCVCCSAAHPPFIMFAMVWRNCEALICFTILYPPLDSSQMLSHHYNIYKFRTCLRNSSSMLLLKTTANFLEINVVIIYTRWFVFVCQFFMYILTGGSWYNRSSLFVRAPLKLSIRSFNFRKV